jgi:hypothetical protein
MLFSLWQCSKGVQAPHGVQVLMQVCMLLCIMSSIQQVSSAMFGYVVPQLAHDHTHTVPAECTIQSGTFNRAAQNPVANKP